MWGRRRPGARGRRTRTLPSRAEVDYSSNMFAFVTHGCRAWKSAKAVALLAATALAVGIGSATAIYTVIDAVLMKPVPWQHGERFVALFSARLNNTSKWQVYGTSWLDLLDYQQRTRSFDAFGVLQHRAFNLTSPGEPQHLRGVEVTPSLASSLGVAPVVGRWFGEAASERGNVNLAVISSALWNRLGGDPKIVGQALTMDGRAVHGDRCRARVVSTSAGRSGRERRIPNRRLGATQSARPREKSRCGSLLRLRQAQARRIHGPSRRGRETRGRRDCERVPEGTPGLHRPCRQSAGVYRQGHPARAAAALRSGRSAAADHVRQRRGIAVGEVGNARAERPRSAWRWGPPGGNSASSTSWKGCWWPSRARRAAWS